MKEIDDNDMDFVVRRYEKDRYDPRKAIARFHEAEKVSVHRRWWATAAAVAASVVLLFAAGYGIRSWILRTPEPAPVEQPALNPDVAQTHRFVYENVPVRQVLDELSAYYHCHLETAPTDKCLTATFPDDDITLIVQIIETALNIEITLEP